MESHTQESVDQTQNANKPEGSEPLNIKDCEAFVLMAKEAHNVFNVIASRIDNMESDAYEIALSLLALDHLKFIVHKTDDLLPREFQDSVRESGTYKKLKNAEKGVEKLVAAKSETYKNRYVTIFGQDK